MKIATMLVTFPVVVGLGCQSTPPEPEAKPSGTATATVASSQAVRPKVSPAVSTKKVLGKPTASVTPAPDDPAKGVFGLDEATKGLAGDGPLQAQIDTSLGALTCDLFSDKAPITVANFVGLARGLRPWKDPAGAWVKKPAYDGTVFHRIIKGFMIQGGDPKKNGSGDGGYVIPDEIWEGGSHDRAGLLCMANRGPNTNGMQFFITDAAAPHLDNGYTILGECRPVDVVNKIASVPVSGGQTPDSPPQIKSVKIVRAPKADDKPT